MKGIRLGVFGGVFGVLVFANLLVLQEIAKRQAVELRVLNVGQGDAILIQTPQGHDILIDGGPDEKVVESLGKEMALWNRDLELMVLTHPDADHVSGLVDVLSGYKAEQVLWTGVQKDTKAFRAWKDKALESGAAVTVSEPGQEIRWSKGRSVLRVLYPGQEEKKYPETNETSMVLLLDTPALDVLLTGDIARKGEAVLARQDVAADVLKVAHHGSKTSSTPAFLRAVNPAIAVISAGKDNRFGHPAPAVLERLAGYGIQVYRTDELGTITFTIPQ